MAAPLIAMAGIQILSAVMQDHNAKQALAEQKKMAKENLAAQLEIAKTQFEQAKQIGDAARQDILKESIAQNQQQLKVIAAEEREIRVRLAEIEETFNALNPPEFNLKITDKPDVVSQKVPPTAFDFSKISPKQLKLVGKYSPAIAEFVETSKPVLASEIVKEDPNSKEAQAAQIEALRRFREIALGETDPELEGFLNKAAERAQVEAQSRSESIMQDRARRGRLGGGDELAMQLEASASGQRRMSDEMQNAAEAAYRNRLEALKNAGTLGGGMESQAYQRAAGEADVINRFNEMTSKTKQDWLNKQAQALNESQLYNLGQEQRISEANIGAENQAAFQQQEYLNRLRQAKTQEEFDRIKYENAMKEKSYGWDLDERDFQNKMAQQAYENEIAKARGIASAGELGIEATRGIAGRNLGAINQLSGGRMGASNAYYDALLAGATGANKATAGALGEYYPTAAKLEAEEMGQRNRMIQTGADITSQGINTWAEQDQKNTDALAADRRAYNTAFFEREGRFPAPGEIDYMWADEDLSPTQRADQGAYNRVYMRQTGKPPAKGELEYLYNPDAKYTAPKPAAPKPAAPKPAAPKPAAKINDAKDYSEGWAEVERKRKLKYPQK